GRLFNVSVLHLSLFNYICYMKYTMFVKYILSTFLAFSFFASLSQELKTSSTPKIFFNCQQARCYEDFLIVELTYFDIVRDQQEADVQIFITDQTNASGGRVYQVNFIGQHAFDKQDQLVEFATKNDDTVDIQRNKILKNIKRGLYQYVLASNLGTDVVIDYPKIKPIITDANSQIDKWNNWIFGVGADGRFEGESNRKSIRTDGFFRGGRTTDESKFSFNTYFNQRANSVIVDSVENKVVVNSYGFNTLYVKSFSKNWSIGGLGRVQ
ncbi:MAG: hypothetical protein NWQ46_11390, partial [Spirosomaceae bacterium]|nr:hypothetical protein [Spirosomataceae bacterium]